MSGTEARVGGGLLRCSYLVAANTANTNYYSDEELAIVYNLYSVRLVLLLIFILGLLVLYVGYFVPLVQRLDSQQKRSLSLLLLIPFEEYVVERVGGGAQGGKLSARRLGRRGSGEAGKRGSGEAEG
jgi:hypothetical protein